MWVTDSPRHQESELVASPLINSGGKAAYRVHPHTTAQTARQSPIYQLAERNEYSFRTQA